MDEIFSKFDGGSAAATAIRAGVDGQTIGTVELTAVAAQKRLFFASGGGMTVFLNPPSGGNDSAMIQAKVDALAAAGGGTLVVPTGVYLCVDIAPCNNLTIQGEGWGSILKHAPGLAGDVLVRHYTDSVRSNIIICDLQIDGNKSVIASGRGVNLEASKNVVIERCYIHDCLQANIQLGHPNVGGEVGGKYRVINNWVADAGDVNGWGNIGISGGTDIIVAHNISTNSTLSAGYAIDVEPNDGWLAERVLIEGNICVEGNILLIAVASGIMRHAMVRGNYVDARHAAGQGAAILLQDVSGRCYVLNNDVVAPLTTSPGIVAYGSGITMLGVGENTVTGVQNIQGTTPDHVGMQIYGNAGFIRNNHIQAAAPTHATLLAGIDGGTQMKVFGNTFENITVPFPAAFRQSGSLVLTAALPAASAQMAGVTLIEDAGAGVYHRISYLSPTVRLRDLTAF